MSMRPLFTTAPRLKLRIGSQTIGYAIGFNVSVALGVEPVYVVGEYGPVALEPTMYNTVSGAIQIVRLRSSESLAAALAANPGSSASVASQFKTSQVSGQPGQTTNSILNQQNLFRMLDPAQVLLTRTFDIDVYIRVPVIDQNIKVANGQNVTPQDFKIDLQSNKESNGILEEFNLMTIKDVRITSRNTNITMGTLVNEPVNFQGLLLMDLSGAETGSDVIAKDSTITQG